MEKSVHTSLSPELPIDKSLAVNIERLKAFTGGSSDVIIKDGILCGRSIAVITCEGMSDTDTLAQLIYSKLNNVDNKEQLPPEEVMSRLFERYLIAAEQLEIANLGDPTLVFEMQVIGERSNTDICLCYLSDKVSPALLEDVKRRVREIKLNTILESGYIQPFFEGSGGWSFSECGTCERPDSFAAKLYEGRVGILVDGTPFALTVPYLFIENFQTMDDYTQKPFYALFIRILRLSAYFITLFLPGAYVAVAAYSPEMLPSALILNLAAAEQTAPYSLMAECLLIHFLYEILREAGIRLPRPIGHAIGVVGGIVIGDITVNAGLVGAPMVLIVALSGLCSFVVPALYERTVLLRFIYILAGGIFGLYGLLLAAGVIIIKMCSLNTYGVPYMAPISPFNPRSSRDMLVRAGWRRLQKGDVTLQGLNGSHMSKE